MSRVELAKFLTTRGRKVTKSQVVNWELGRSLVPGDIVLDILGAATDDLFLREIVI